MEPSMLDSVGVTFPRFSRSFESQNTSSFAYLSLHLQVAGLEMLSLSFSFSCLLSPIAKLVTLNAG